MKTPFAALSSQASADVRLSPFLALLLAAWLNPQTSRADNTWDGGGSSPFNWSDTTNWGLNTAPSYGTLIFNGTVGTTNTLDGNFTTAANTSMNQVNWNGASAWVMNSSGGAVLNLFDNGGVQAKLESLGTGGVTINAPITFGATAGAAWGEINAVSSSMTFGSTGTLTVNGSAVAGIRLFGGSGAISTTFNNTVSATGKYFSTSATGQTVNVGGSFTAANFYLMNTGTLNLNAGGNLNGTAVRLGGDFATTGTQNLALGATFNLTPLTGGLTFAGVVNSVASNTSGLLTVNSQNTSATNTLSNQVALDSALKITQAAGGTLAITQVKGVDNTTGTDIKGNTLTFTPAATGTINHSGTIYNSTGTGVVTMNGAGTLVLSGTNTYSGTTNVSTGVVNIQNGSALGAVTTGTTVTSGAALQIQGNITTLAEPLSLNGTGITTTGALRNISGTNNFAGLITLAGATRINSDAGTLTISNAGTILGATFGLTVGGAGNTTINSIIGTTTGGLTKDGAGTLSLTGANTYTGVTDFTAGIVNVASLSNYGAASSSLGARLAATEAAAGNGIGLHFLGGTLQYTGATAQTTDRQMRISNAGATIDASGSVAAATLSFTYSAANLNYFDTAGARTLTLTGTNTGANLYALNIQDQATTAAATSLVKSGIGTWVITNANNGAALNGANSTFGGFSGGTTISAGMLIAQNAAALGAAGRTVSIGASATLDLQTDTTINALNTTITGTGATIISDKLTAASVGITHTLGTLSIGAFTLNVTRGANATSGTGGLTFGATTLTGNAVFDTAANTNLTMGAITGSFNLTKQNSGQITLSTASTRAVGVNTLTAGTMLLGSVSALGTTATTLALNGGTLDLATDTTVNAYNTTVGGTTTINSNKLTAASAGITHTLGTLSIGAFTLNVTRGANATSGTGGLTFGATTLTGNAVFDTAANTNLTLGAITGSFNLTKQNSGQITLSTASTRAVGVNTLTAGTMLLGSVSALGTTATTLALNGGTLDLATDTTVNAYNTTVGGTTTINSNKLTAASAGITHTLGTLSIGAFTLNVARGANATTGIGGVTFGAVTLTGAPTFTAGANALLTLGAITNGANLITVNGAGDMAITGIVGSGAGGITKSAAGTLTLSGVNTYTGVTTLSGGILRATTSVQALGTGAATLSLGGGTLQLANESGLSFARNTTVTASTTIASDRLISGGAAATHTLGTLSIGAQTLSVTRGANATTGVGQINFGAVTMTGNSIFDPQANAELLIGAVGGAFPLTKIGAGILELNGAGTYSGISDIQAGTLRLSNAGGFGNSTAINLTAVASASATTLDIRGTITAGAGKTVTLNTNTTGDLRSTFLNGANNNTWAGNIVLAGTGFAQINAASATTLTLTGNLTSSGAAGTGTMAARGAGTVVIAGNVNFGTDRNFTHTDTGTVIVNSTGNIWKGTQISDGQMQLGINDALATGVELQIGQNSTTSGRLEMSGFNQTVAALRTFTTSTGTGHIIRNSSLATPSTLTFTTAPATTDILKSAAVQGSTTTPGTTGALHLVKNGTGRMELETGIVDADSWTVNAGTLAFTGNATRTLPGTLTVGASATIDKTGTGSLVASGVWNNAGATTVSGGTLVLSSGAAGTITVADTATLSAGLNGGAISAASLTFGSAGATAFRPILSTPAAAAVISPTALTTAGTTVTVSPSAAAFSIGTYKLIDYAGTIGGNGYGGFTLGTVGTYPHITANLVDNTADGRVDLNVSAVDSLIWTGATNATWDVNTTSNFKLASNNAASTFFPSDAVLFDDSGANKAITVSGAPEIGNLTFNNSTGNDYTLTGSFTGVGGITKSNTGTVTLASATSYSGPVSVASGTLVLSGANSTHGNVSVTGGTLKFGAVSALANQSSVVTISSGGTLDFGGLTPVIKMADLRVSGTGVGGNGAIFNSGAAITNNTGAAKVTLLGDTTWGGVLNGRFDMSLTLFQGGSFTLTKVGLNESWWGPNTGSTLGPVVVNGGVFGVQSTLAMTSTDAPITVNAAGTLGLFSTLNIGRAINLNDGVISSRGSTPNLTGTITLQAGDVAGLPVNQIGGTSTNVLAISGSLVGPGGFEKNDTGTVTIQSNTHTYAGNTLITGGTLNFSAAGLLPSSTNLIANSGTFDPSNLTHTFASLSGTGGSINQATAGTGLVVSNQSTTTTFGGTLNRATLRMAGSGMLTLNGTAVNTSPVFEANAGTLVLAGTLDNSAGIATANNGGTLVLAKTGADLSVHAVGTGLTINSGGLVKLGGSVTAQTGTGVNAPPVGIPTNYVDQIYNASAFTINTGGTFDLAGMSEAVNTIAGTGGTITNSVAATTSRLYIGHQNGNTTYAGIIQDGTGTVALEKIGTGSLTLTGANTYTGATVLTAGGLTVPSGASLGNTPITLAAGTFTIDGTAGTGSITQNGGTLTGAGTLGGTITTASGGIITIGTASNGVTAATLTAGGLTFSGGAIINADFTGTVLDKIALGAGALNLSGTNTVNVALGGAGWVTGVYPLISYGTLASGGVANFTLSTPVGHNVVNFTDAGGAINLDVTAGTVKWNGNVIGGVWDNNNVLNWQSADFKYLNGDNVLFDDSAAGPSFNPTVTTANVTPASVTFNNSTNAYTLSGGTLGIAGAGQLFKQGTNTVTLTNANTYTGATNVQNGTLIANYNSGTATTVLAATSTINVSSGATFRAVTNDANFTLANALTGTGTVVIDPHLAASVAVRDVTISGNNTGFTGTLRLSPTNGVATGLGTFRTIALTPTTAGGATIDVDSGGQAWINGSTFANSFILTGMGYAEAAGGTPVAASGLTQYSGATKGGIGAIRMDTGAIISGNITLDGNAKIMPYNGTGTISGSIGVTNASDTLVVGGGGAGSTLILTGTNNVGANSLKNIFVNSGGTAGTNVLAIGANGTTGTLGTGSVTLNGDAAAVGLLRFDRSDGYSLVAGNTITGSGTTLGNTFIEFDTQGTGFSSNGNAITLGTAAAGGTFRVGQNRANTVTSINAGLTGTNLLVGSGAAGATLNLNSGATVSATALTIGASAAGTGATVNISTGATVNVANVSVAVAATNATLNITGGTVNATGNFFVGEQSGFSGTVNQSGGDVSAGTHFRIGHWPSNTSAYNISGGSLTAANINSATDPSGGAEQNGGIYLGVDGTGTMTQSNSMVTTDFIVLDNRGDTVAGTNMPDGIDRYTLNSGTLVFRSQWGLTQRNVTTAVTLAGGTIRNGGTNLQVRMDTAPDISGALTLDTVSAGNSFNWIRNLTGAGSVTLSGGGTMKFTTTGTQTVSVPISGTGAVEKLGTGTTTLSATNTYNGATTITAGRLNLGGSIANSALTLASGASVAGEVTAASLTFNGGTIIIDPNTGGALTATGALTTTGTNLVDFTALPTGLGPFTVVNYGTTFTGTTSNFALATPANFRSPAFADTGSGVGPASITLNFATADLIWTGTGGNTWNIATTTNWNDTTPAASAFYTGDRLTLDDSALGSATSITLAGSLQPGALTVNSSAGGNNYTLTASAGNVITAGTSLLKTGTSTLTMAGNVANTFTGGSTIAQGAVNLQHIQSLGTGVITLNNATTGANNTSLYLDTNRPAGSTYVSNITIANQGTGTSTLGSRANVGSTGVMGFQNITLAKDVTFDSNAADRTDYNNISGTGNVTVGGTGRSLFMSANTWVGDLIVSTTGAGSLQIGTVSGVLNAIPDTANVTVNSGALLNLSVSGNESINGLNGAGTLGINSANSTLTVGASNGGGSFSGIMQGSGANTLTLVKAGTGTQIISGANTYGGTTTISGGILQVGAGGASGQLGTGAVSLATGTSLSYLRTGSVTQTGALNSATAGAGTLNVDGGAVLTLNVGGNFSGTVNVLNGSLVAGATNVWATGASAPAVNLSAGTSLTNTGNSNLVHLGNVSLNGATITTGTGIGSTDGENYLLNGNVTVTGTAPSFITRDVSRSDANSGFSLNGVRTFDVADVTTSTAADLTVSTELENPSGVVGGLTKISNGTMVLANNNSYTGVTTITAGTLQIGAAGTTGTLGSGNVVNDAALVFNRSNAQVVLNAISGVGTVIQAGTGTTTFNAAQTYSGGTIIAAGTLSLSGAGSLANAGTVDLNGATGSLDLSGISATSETIGSLAGVAGSSVVLGAKTLVTGGNNGSTSFGGVISGTGGFTKEGSGSQTMTAAQTFTGGTNLTGGSLILTGSGALADTSAVNLAASTIFDIAGITSPSETVGSLSGASTSSVVLGDRSLVFGLDNANTTFSGVASGTDGSLTKVGTGTTTISGNNTYTGNTNINGGTLLMASSNTLPDTAALNLSSGATLNTGGYSDTTGALSVTNTVNFDMGSSAGSALTFANIGTWTGLLNVWNYTGAAWTVGTDKLIFTAGGVALDDLHVNFYGGPVGDTASLIGTGGGGLIGNELVPVPEPSAIASLLALFGLAGFKERRRFFHFRK